MMTFAKFCKILQNFAAPGGTIWGCLRVLRESSKGLKEGDAKISEAEAMMTFAKFCKVLQNFAKPKSKPCKTLQNFAKFCKILQPLGERSGDVYGCSEAEFMMTKMTIY